jgi:uracil phosphoribosyltransferase/adenylate kinase/phosphoserine phosphatase
MMTPIDCENFRSSMPDPTPDSHANQPPSRETQSAASNKTVVIGLYGVPGSGKTFLLSQLKQEFGKESFEFYEGSEVIANLVPGGLGVFQQLDEQEKHHWRQLAIDVIGQECAESGRVAVVAGHFMFWPEGEEAGRPVYTRNDLNTFTHILYLDVRAECVAERRLDDTERTRPSVSIKHLRKWQEAEKSQLRRLCRDHGILFSVVASHPTLLNKISMLLRDFRHHSDRHNLSRAESRLDELLMAGQGQLETVLVMDADGTLAANDTGLLFWNMVSTSRQWGNKECPLKTLFSSSLGYSYPAFRQAALLYEEVADDQEFDALCKDAALAVTMYPEIVSLLQVVAEQEHVRAIVVTCGLRHVWEKILEKEGLSQTVKVIGGGRIADGFVITATVKAALVTRLRDSHKLYVWAFGDSLLDLPMLGRADQAIVVVGEEQTRGKTMDAALLRAIAHDGLRARQALLPNSVSPRLDTTKLPLIQLKEQEVLNSILCRRNQYPHLQVLHATDRKAAKLLMTPTREATVAGPVLREAHRRIGWYLAIEFVADKIGVDGFPIPHVQGHQTSGHRLRHEQQTLIVAILRGGEPMAFGVNDAFPLAMFIHASRPEDIKPHHLQGQRTMLLVDSVVNSGGTVVEFVDHVHSIYATIDIVVVAGVAHTNSVSGNGGIAQAVIRHPNLSLVALRLSDNKFTGRGTTDTGNRLFNTTHLP